MLHLLDRVLRISWFVILGLIAIAIVTIGLTLGPFAGSGETPVDVVLFRSPVSVDQYQRETGAVDVILNESDAVAIESVSYTSSDAAAGMVTALIVLIGVVLFLYGYRLLQRVVSSAAREDPFTAQNVTRIRRIALVALAAVVLRSAAPVLSALFAALRREGTRFSADLNIGVDVTGLLVFLILLAIAEVFARGVELREENELTI